MKANEIPREKVEAFLESDEGREYMQFIDRSYWKKVMKEARENGFVVTSAGGVAVLSTYGAMLEQDGVKGAARMMQMSGVDLPEEVLNVVI